MAWGDLKDTRPEDYLELGKDPYASTVKYDQMLAGELTKRYKAKTWQEVAEPLHEELGLKKYKLKIREKSQPIRKNLQIMGRFDPNTRQLEIDPDLKPEHQIATAAHELEHAADNIHLGYDDGEQSGNFHHQKFLSYEPEMTLILQAQSAIENGEPVNPAILDRYPELKDVVPQSSNPLAHPWRDHQPEEDPGIWNALMGRTK